MSGGADGGVVLKALPGGGAGGGPAWWRPCLVKDVCHQDSVCGELLEELRRWRTTRNRPTRIPQRVSGAEASW
ncbi:unnamed protein product [Boreogadus saida]